MYNASVYHFNPTCELAVANGSFSYMPPLLLQEMESDLSILPFVFGTEKDFVLTENPPSAEFLKVLKNAGFNLPNFCRLQELEALPDGSFDSIIPWGWSPAVHFKYKNLKEKCNNEFRRSPVFKWKEEHQLLFERSTSLDFLNNMLNNNPPKWFIDPAMCGVIVISCEEIERLLKKHSAVVLKAPVSSSGRGIQIIRKSKLNTSNIQWISGVLKQQKYLIAEPYLDKLIDLSFQFEVMDKSNVIYHGFSVFETNSNGQYKGTWIHPDLRMILPKEDLMELNDKIEVTANLLNSALRKSEFAISYRGYLGIDALIYKNQELMMQPCIEVNCRMTMGMFSIRLENKIHQDTSGKFELCLKKTGEFRNYASTNSVINDLKFRDGKIYSGFLPLVEPDANKKFGAYLSLGSAR
jgi:hypothetical protein